MNERTMVFERKLHLNSEAVIHQRKVGFSSSALCKKNVHVMHINKLGTCYVVYFWDQRRETKVH